MDNFGYSVNGYYAPNNYITVSVDNQGNIWDHKSRQMVGISLEKESNYQQTIKDMQETLDNYYNKLVELGVITPELTPEQIIAQEMQEQKQAYQALLQSNLAMMKTMEKITEKLGGMQCELNTDGSDGGVKVSKQGQARNKSSAKSSKEDGKGSGE